MSCIAVFSGSIATSGKGYIIYIKLIFVVYFNYVLAGLDTSQQFLILVMYPFRIKNCFFKPITAILFIQKSTTLVNRKGRIKILQTLGIKNMFFSYMFISSKGKVQAFQE